MPGRTVIALVDPVWNGHSPTYFSLFWKALAQRRQMRLVGFCPQPEAARKLLADQGILDADVRELKCSPPPGAKTWPFAELRQKMAQWKHLRSALQQAEADGLPQIDLAFILWLEPFMARYLFGMLVDWLFSYPWTGLYLHPYHFRIKPSRRHWLRNALFPAHAPVLARRCRAVLTLDEGIIPAMCRKTGKPVLRLPDVTDTSPAAADSELANQIKTKADGRMICGLFGVLQKRKGILPLLQAAAQQPHGWFFVFAGPVPRNDYSESEWNYMQQFMEANPGNCYFWPRPIDEAGFNSGVAACDVIFAAYELFPHSSNIMTKAALFQKPIIVSPGYLMAERVKAFRLGWVLPDLSAGSILELLTGLNREQVWQAGETALFNEYFAEHDNKSLVGVLDKLIQL